MSSTDYGSSPAVAALSGDTDPSPTTNMDIDDIKEKVEESLQAVGDGFFATSGPIPSAVNPGLFIKGLGRVGLPLSSRDAKDLVKISQAASFAEDDQKLVNQSVPRVWGIDPAQVEFRNPQWSKTVQYAVSKTVDQLGVLGGVSSVRAALHKLLLYEEGDFLEVHRATERTPGTFATLVIMLPSEHDGGDVVVQFGKDKRTLSNPESNEFTYAFLAWYADMNYSIQPVTSGYRLILTYNLIHRSGALDKARPPSILVDHNLAIDSVFKAWKTLLETDVEAPQELIYLFDQQDSGSSLGLSNLRGQNQTRALHLHKACKRHCFNLFLAQLEHSKLSKEDADEEDEDDEDSHNWYLTKLFTTDGVCIAESIDIDKEAVTLDDPFDGWSPDDEESEGGYDDEGPSCTEYYRRSCLVVVPEKQFNSFLNRASRLKFREWANALLLRMDDKAQAVTARTELLQICPLIQSQYNIQFQPLKDSLLSDTKGDSYDGYDSLLSVAIKLDMPSLLIPAIGQAPYSLGIDARQRLAQAIVSRDVTPWLPVISASIAGKPSLSFRLADIMEFEREYKQAVVLSKSPERTAGTEKDKEALVQKCMNEALIKEPKDGLLQVGAQSIHLTLLTRVRSQGESSVLEIVLPICKLVVRDMNFVADVLSQLFREIKNEWVSRSTVSTFARQVVPLLAEEMTNLYASTSSRQATAENVQPRTQYPWYNAGRTAYGHMSMPHGAIAKLFTHCEMLELHDSSSVLTRALLKIVNGSGTSEAIKTNDLYVFFMPLIRSLVAELPAVSNDLLRYRVLIHQVLYDHFKNHVGERPYPPQNLSRAGNTSSCSVGRGYHKAHIDWYDCKECRALNDFFTAPDRSEWLYKGSAPDRQHLERRMRGLDCNFWTDDRHGTPYTLIIQKNANSYHNAFNAWQGRSVAAKRELGNFGQERLKAFLGDQFESTMEQLSEVISGKPMPAGRQPLTPLTASTQNNKRASEGLENGPDGKRAKHVDVIDLC
ncbi:MAG: hypothetical protein Q9174_004199 [Haloplaca sp. 1 TL-2023]